MRQTAKLKAALEQCRGLGLLPGSNQDAIYDSLDRAGYKWDADAGQWIERPGIDPAFTQGSFDLRLRVANGELDAVVPRVTEILETVGFVVVETSKPYPDDRHGPARTSRVYIKVKL